jgi:hypothetical protein
MMMGCNGFLHCLGKVVPQVPAVGDFDRFGCSGAGGFGIRAGTVAADHLGTGMCSQPFGNCFGFPIGENIDGSVSAHIDQNCAVTMPPTESEIVDAKHFDSGRGRIR